MTDCFCVNIDIQLLSIEAFDCRKSRAFYFVWSAHFYANLNIFVKVYLCLLRRFVFSRLVPGITKATNSQLQLLQIRLRLNINFLHSGVGRNAFLILLLLHLGHFRSAINLFCKMSQFTTANNCGNLTFRSP